MMYRGTPLATRYEEARPEPSTVAQLLSSLLGTALFGLSVALVLGAFYVVAGY